METDWPKRPAAAKCEMLRAALSIAITTEPGFPNFPERATTICLS
jgi:hypothetical protein